MAKTTKSTGHGRGEQRGAPRRPAAWQAEASLGEEARAIKVGNISRGGLMFSISAPARVPATMDVHLALPGGGNITLTGSVRHVARRAASGQPVEIDIGVQFAGLDDEQTSALDSALSSLPSG